MTTTLGPIRSQPGPIVAQSGPEGPTGPEGPEGPAGVAGPAGPGAGESGNATIDFGAFPGHTDASVAITGKSGILADSVVRVAKRIEASADHSADEHWVERFKVEAGAIDVGVGFTVYAKAEVGRMWGQWNISWNWL